MFSASSFSPCAVNTIMELANRSITSTEATDDSGNSKYESIYSMLQYMDILLIVVASLGMAGNVLVFLTAKYTVVAKNSKGYLEYNLMNLPCSTPPPPVAPEIMSAEQCCFRDFVIFKR